MTNNPLLQKYEELHKKPEPPKDPYSHLQYKDRALIYELERLMEDLKTGRASYNHYEVKDNYARANPIPFWEIKELSTKIDDSPFVKYDKGQMITIQVFRSYV